uniref:RNA helicase n=1 Tax=Podarcis muralis TaxID=64176 RepID=A0A670K3W2_PODMU
MFEVFILKIENPWCFWGYIKGGGSIVENEMEYKKLQSEMNLFYNKFHRYVDDIKPSVLEKGQVCAVYCQEMKSWCRAVVKSIISCTDYYLAECFLVDYAKSVPVKTDRICVALESFMRLPYRAMKFRLYGTKPATLRVNYYNDKAKIVPANRWDIAAIHYFQNLLNATTKVEAKLCAVEEDSFDVDLYVTIKEEKICVNDDLLAKKFAFYEAPKSTTISAVEDQKRETPLSLEPLSEEINPALVLWPMLLQAKETKAFETCEYDRSASQMNRQDGGYAFRPAVLNKNIEPCLSLETAPLFPTLKKVELLRNQFPGPNHVQSYSWPPIARGCDSVIISPENDPLLYLLPIITFLQSRSCYVSLPARSGPVALILCPGQKKAELVFEFLETYSRCSRPIHPILLLLGTNKEEIQSIRIPRGCEVLITTPYTLLRLLEYHSLLFLRLCHLVLDEIDVLFAEANIEIFRILEYYKTALNVEEKESAPQQIVAIGRHWSKNIEHLTKEFMNDPYVVITSMEEAAIYGKVQQVVQLCLECDRISTLLQSLDFTPTNVQKTLIFTSSVEETDIIYKISSLEKEQPNAKSILLLTEKSAPHAVGVMHYLKRTETNIPPELCNFTSGVLEAKEDRKKGRPLCRYLKAYGVCKDKKRCPDRHRVSLQIDVLQKVTNETLPATGNVTILPLFIVDATNYFGRIVSKQKDPYAALADEVNAFYKKAKNLVPADPLEKLAVYGLREENTFHRVQVLEVPPKGENSVFYSVHIKYIDEGRFGQVQNYKLLYLPEQFQALPPQAVEFIVCRVKPIDNEVEWNPKVTRYINQMIRGKPHEAKIVLALGNTIWVDPVVRVTRLLDLKTSINEYNIRSKILSTGMGTDNPEHISELQKLYRDAETVQEEKELPALGLDSMALVVSSNSMILYWKFLCRNLYLKIKSILTTVFFPFFSFYPSIKWFEKQDVVVLKIKLQNITSYDCKFFSQRIIFSASVEDRFYLADMELQKNIIKEKSACDLKNGEPVITLAKEKAEPWCNLLKHKNPHVSFDFDYLDYSEERSPFSAGKPLIAFYVYVSLRS